MQIANTWTGFYPPSQTNASARFEILVQLKRHHGDFNLIQLDSRFANAVWTAVVAARALGSRSCAGPLQVPRAAVLINLPVYASEGLRDTLAPQISHMPVLIFIAVLAAIDGALIAFGLNRFFRKAVS